MKVIGAGFGRTGTMSLKLALEQLGYGPCYHMMEVSRNQGHCQQWRDAEDGARIDWEALFAAYNSTVDWPAARFWRILWERFPSARVVLSLRDGQRWYESMRATIFTALADPTASSDPVRRMRRAMARKLILHGTFNGRAADRDHVVSVYERHNREVINTIPPDSLLVYRATDGWQPLCEFLGVSVPATPYPNTNNAAEFSARMLADRDGRTSAEGHE